MYRIGHVDPSLAGLNQLPVTILAHLSVNDAEHPIGNHSRYDSYGTVRETFCASA
jgi:hypothetical protein